MPKDRSETRRAPSPFRGKSLVAAGKDLSKRIEKHRKVQIRQHAWQIEAWRLYDTVPEYRFACDWVGSLLSKATLVPLKNGKPTTDPIVVEALDAFFGGAEGHVDLLRDLGRHLTVAGDCYVIGYDDGGLEDEWRVVSANKLRGGTGNWTLDGDPLPADTLAFRIWEPHPRDYKEANSPSRAVLPVLAELEGLTMGVAADIDSRLISAGLLLVPEEMNFPATPVVNGDGTDEAVAGAASDASDFVNMLMDVAAEALGDRSSAAAKVPVVIQGRGEDLQYVRHLSFWSGFDEHSQSLREEAIHRLALGMDMPPEALTGTEEMNHWNAWQMEEATIKAHSEPLLKRIVASLVEGFLRPYIASDLDDPQDALAYSIGVDTSELRLRPNRSKEAQELYDRAAISLATLLRENGFDPESDAMADGEMQQWFLRKVASGSTTPEQVLAALEALKVPLEVAESATSEAARDDSTREARPTPSLIGHPTRNPPEQTDSEAAAAEIIVYRALERAGNRLKTRLRGQIPVGVSAADLYQYVQVNASDLDDLLDDAWSCVDRFSAKLPADRLDSYTRSLIMSRKPHSIDVLAAHLRLDDEAA